MFSEWLLSMAPYSKSKNYVINWNAQDVLSKQFTTHKWATSCLWAKRLFVFGTFVFLLSARLKTSACFKKMIWVPYRKSPFCWNFAFGHLQEMKNAKKGINSRQGKHQGITFSPSPRSLLWNLWWLPQASRRGQTPHNSEPRFRKSISIVWPFCGSAKLNNWNKQSQILFQF